MMTTITRGEEYLSQADIDKVNADVTNEWPKLRDSGVLDELFEALLVDFPPPLDLLDEWVSTVNYGFQSSHSSDSNCTMVADRDIGQFRDVLGLYPPVPQEEGESPPGIHYSTSQG